MTIPSPRGRARYKWQLEQKLRMEHNHSLKVLVARGGGNRNDKYLNKACTLNALQPPIPANRNKRNKMTNLLVPNIVRTADFSAPVQSRSSVALADLESQKP